MKAKIGCFAAVVGIVTGAWAVELKNGAEFAMKEVPAEAKAELPKGGSIRFLLEENGTTGYGWTAAYSSNEVEVVVEHRGPLVKDGRCGAPGVAAVRANLKGNDAAPVFIEMKYVRPWEKGSPAKTMRIVLYKVKDGITSSNYPESRTLAMLKEECRNRGIVITDWHMHIRGGLTPEMAAERERLCGIRSSAMENHGREWEIFDNAQLVAFAAKAKKAKVNGRSLPVGIQVNDRDWFKQIDAKTRAQFDYILADTMIMGKLPNGRDKRLWLVTDLSQLGAEPEAWMDEYVKMNLQVLDEPISILANPTYLPAPLDAMADRLWTPDRMKAIIAKAVARGVAIEIQAESPYPRPRFLKLAKEMGAKFSFGSNNYDAAPKDLSRWLEAILWLDLKAEDVWQPTDVKPL